MTVARPEAKGDSHPKQALCRAQTSAPLISLHEILAANLFRSIAKLAYSSLGRKTESQNDSFLIERERMSSAREGPASGRAQAFR
ncbi:hypothetical protein NAC44_18565 [Allorhizobium sp. BGMRC 0089]|uniref:hypothetical protein n=1 Tax=Allorhizobium sonneratiae TaxID=2934936 RepID=UPI00203338F9|nr:hypothetical protein [Allorhizobium sonneratiae]MCM2294332.1 hypothetical protein [Allorhizobium sonneratiae]